MGCGGWDPGTRVYVSRDAVHLVEFAVVENVPGFGVGVLGWCVGDLGLGAPTEREGGRARQIERERERESARGRQRERTREKERERARERETARENERERERERARAVSASLVDPSGHAVQLVEFALVENVPAIRVQG